MSDPNSSAPPPTTGYDQPQGQNKEVSDRIGSASVPTLVRILKVCNFINAAFLCTSGILVFVLESLTLLLVLSALYVITFSLLLLCFECHLKRFEKVVYKNFGFMFHWQGRCLFFFFIGTLAFGLGTWGIVAGSVTLANVLFNIYVLRNNEFYRQHVRDQTNEMRVRARSDLTKPGATGAPAGAPTAPAGPGAPPVYNNNPTNTLAGAALNAAAANPEAAVKVATVGISVAGTAVTAANASEWERFLDEDTGTYYYYNSRTQETRWEEPK